MRIFYIAYRMILCYSLELEQGLEATSRLQ